jgi:hypothetical protein
MTAEGRQWLANLYCHVCVIEHGRRTIGPAATVPQRDGPHRDGPAGIVVRDFVQRRGR